jgi:hypothetical protein
MMLHPRFGDPAQLEGEPEAGDDECEGIDKRHAQRNDSRLRLADVVGSHR